MVRSIPKVRFVRGYDVALPDGIRIRVLRRGDRDVYRLLAEAGTIIAANDQSNTLAWVVSHPESEVQVAVDALDRAVGLISMSHRPQLKVGGRIATIDEFVVTAPLRRHGIGTELLEKVLNRAKMLGCKRVEIGAPPETGSRGYFQKRGFAPEGMQVLSWRNMDAK